MRRIMVLMTAIVASALLMGVGPVQPNPRACGGTTRAGGYLCCVSGTVTLKGVPVGGAIVTVRTEKGLKAGDVTGVAGGDRFPTYGFQLNGEELQAAPGDVVTLTADYQGWSRTVELVVEYGELWLDIELLSVPDERLGARLAD